MEEAERLYQPLKGSAASRQTGNKSSEQTRETSLGLYLSQSLLYWYKADSVYTWSALSTGRAEQAFQQDKRQLLRRREEEKEESGGRTQKAWQLRHLVQKEQNPFLALGKLPDKSTGEQQMLVLVALSDEKYDQGLLLTV